MAKKEYLIHQFCNEIFPRKLWVIRDAPYSWIKERFKYIKDDDEIEEYTKYEAKSVTYSEIEYKKTNQYGILIVILDNNLTIKDIAHEATHFAMFLHEAIGETIDTNHQEMMAYIVGYATDCIYQVAKNKFRPMFDGSTEL